MGGGASTEGARKSSRRASVSSLEAAKNMTAQKGAAQCKGKNDSSKPTPWIDDHFLTKGNPSALYEDMGCVLGHGQSGVVHKFRDKATQEFVAIKMIRKEDIKHDATGRDGAVLDSTLIQQEISILRQCQGHKALLQLRGVFETREYVLLVTEFAAGGELFRRIIAKGSFSEAEASNVVLQILSGLEYLHDHGIVHRDIKPENVLLVNKDSLEVKIADFGLAKVRKEDQVQLMLETAQQREREHEKLMNTACGTLLYAAPEVIQRKTYDASVDLWSTGVLLFMMLAGEMPFDTTEKVLTADFGDKFEAPVWKYVSTAAGDLIRAMLQVEPSARLTVAQIRDHEWFKVVVEKGVVPIPASCHTLTDMQVSLEAQQESKLRMFRNKHLQELIKKFQSVELASSPGYARLVDVQRAMQATAFKGFALEASVQPRDLLVAKSVPLSNPGARRGSVINMDDFVDQTNQYFNETFVKHRFGLSRSASDRSHSASVGRMSLAIERDSAPAADDNAPGELLSMQGATSARNPRLNPRSMSSAQ